MNTGDQRATREQFEQAVAARALAPYLLTLFVSGASDSSARAIRHVREICDGPLRGRHELTVVDLNQEPTLAASHHILATPTLVKDNPLPHRIVVGDMSDHESILRALNAIAAPLTPTAVS
jgi:circadian clock protein KaiB